MKFTLNWLRKHIETSEEINSITSKLNDIGLEVESTHDKEKIYGSFIIAEILATEQHPNADKLRVCKVNDGNNILQIVCGAPNAIAGTKVILASIGTKIPANEMLIKKSKIRGVESFGMLCSYEELCLKGRDEDGIIELEESATVGTKFADHANLNEIVIDIALTPNRGDCASVFGIARDLSAAGVGKLKKINSNFEFEFISDPEKIIIEDEDSCSEFCLGKMQNVNNAGQLSDTFINASLSSIEYSPKSPLVDISNFLMFDMGRPNHIYDADKIEGIISVKKSRGGEVFLALDGNQYALPSGITIITDSKKILGVAGVIGGDSSKVDKNTKNILVEVANFHPETVMKAGRELDIITDSRFRFERNIDHGNTEIFMSNLLNTIKNNCGGEVSKTIICAKKKRVSSNEIEFHPSVIKKISGINIPDSKIKDILLGLGFEWNNEKVKVPSWRIHDVKKAEDVVEEVLRIYGFSNIPSIEFPVKFSDINFQNAPNKELTSLMKMLGMNEVMSWSLCNMENAKIFAQSEILIQIKNPISVELSVMRPSILASFLPIIAKNVDRGIMNLGMFEIGNVYSNKYKFKQSQFISGIRTGLRVEKNVHSDQRHVDFFDAKEDVIQILEKLGIKRESLRLTREAPSYYHPGKSACFKLGRDVVAYCGDLHPKILEKAKCKHLVAFEILLDNIPQKKSKRKNIRPISDFQSVIRDFAFVVKEEIEVGDIIMSIKSLRIDELEEIKIFDVYSGKGVENGYKSVALSVKLQPEDRTFTDIEIDNLSKKIKDIVQEKLGGILRQ